ncbi:MAG: DUF4097 domain-containing protein [Treponema sp.]|nr:DUF4097 domain-containing protein [Treponema sp.]
MKKTLLLALSTALLLPVSAKSFSDFFKDTGRAIEKNGEKIEEKSSDLIDKIKYKTSAFSEQITDAVSGLKLVSSLEFTSSRVSNLFVSLTSERLLVVPYSGDDIILETYSKSGDDYWNSGLSGDTLKVSSKNTIRKTQSSVVIYMPAGQVLSDVVLDSTSGSIKYSNINCDNFKADNTSGSINIKNFVCKKAEISSTSGSVSTDNLACTRLIVDTTSGSVKCNDLDCKSFDIDTTSGSVKIELSYMITKDSSIDSTSGSVTLELPDNKGFDLSVSTNSGLVTNEFESNQRMPKNFRASYNGGGPKIRIETTSGRISIEK